MGKTVAQKIFDAHEVGCPGAGVRVISLDRVFCHEITTPIAINDLVSIGRDRVFDPSKIKAVIDHVTPAKDSKTAEQGKTLRDWAKRHQIKDFFDIGANGVCHAIFPEKALSVRDTPSSWVTHTPVPTVLSVPLPPESEPLTLKSVF